MASLHMSGPYKFDYATINRIVEANRIGNYALGYMEGDTFIVEYVGRSNTGVAERLLDHFLKREDYQSFKYSYASSIKAAYEKECQNYHDFGGLQGKLKNKKHPDRPDGCDYKCPCCYIFG